MPREQAVGSSPRGRGELGDLPALRDELGLIPAWAGKTKLEGRVFCLRWAHPRVGGENTRAFTGGHEGDGSSPRRRGKPFHQKWLGR